MQKIKLPIELFSVGSVIYIDFPYDEDKAKAKRRPAIVIDFNNVSTRVVVLKVTTHEVRTSYDYELANPQLANLKGGSVVRRNHTLTLNNNFKCNKHGNLSRKDLMAVSFLYTQAIQNNDVVTV